MTRRFLIDTDTASDDAVALVMALREPSITVEAITVVAGNVPLDQAVQNALYTAELAGRSEVPIHAGRSAPLMRPLQTAEVVHGNDGMGDIGLPLWGREPAGDRAVEVIVDTIMGSPGEITLVTLGPLTNVAIALLNEPSLADAVDHCFVMGGACAGGGNVTPLAEFNLWADPEAARVVVRSGMPLTLVGWDISVNSATFGPDDAAALRSIGPLGEFAVDIQAVLDVYAREASKIAGFDLPDPIAMAVAIDPTIATYEDLFVDVLIGDGPERGQDVVDWLGVTGDKPNVRVTRHVPRQAFVGMLERLLG
jgi:purine nucleosidase